SRPAVLVHVQDHVDAAVAGPPDHLCDPVQVGGVVAAGGGLEQAPGEAQLDHVEAEVPHLPEVVLAERGDADLRRVGRAGTVQVVGGSDRVVGGRRQVGEVRTAPEVDQPGGHGPPQDPVAAGLVGDVGALAG